MMNMVDVMDCLGCNRSKGELRNMVKALGLHPWLNSAEDKARLRAAQLALADWSTYSHACDVRRSSLRAISRVL